MVPLCREAVLAGGPLGSEGEETEGSDLREREVERLHPPLFYSAEASPLCFFLPFAEVLLDGILPVFVQGGAAPDGGHRLAQHLVIEACALTVAVVVHRTVRGNAQMACCLHRIHVGSQEEKLPAVLLLLPPDHFPYPLGRVAAAGILYAVSDDDEESALRNVFRPGVLVDASDVMDGATDGVQQGGTATDIVLLFRDGQDLAYVYPVMEHLDLVIKEDGGDKSLSWFFLLLFDHGIEATDGVFLQPLHGAATVQNEHQFCQILPHKKSPYAVLFG